MKYVVKWAGRIMGEIDVENMRRVRQVLSRLITIEEKRGKGVDY